MMNKLDLLLMSKKTNQTVMRMATGMNMDKLKQLMVRGRDLGGQVEKEEEE